MEAEFSTEMFTTAYEIFLRCVDPLLSAECNSSGTFALTFLLDVKFKNSFEKNNILTYSIRSIRILATNLLPSSLSSSSSSRYWRTGDLRLIFLNVNVRCMQPIKLHAQLLLQPQLVLHSEHSLCYEHQPYIVFINVRRSSWRLPVIPEWF
jgi:phage-related protein